MISKAIQAIGPGDKQEDWRIEPSKHAQMFAESAPSLSQTLRGVKPQGMAKKYEELNQEAIEARDKFKRAFSRANQAVFATASFAALLLASAGLQKLFADMQQLNVIEWTVRAFGILGIISSGLATMWISRVREGKLTEKWSETRAKAEAKRLSYFKSVMQAAGQSAQDQLLALEYTRRFLLDNQLDYFKDRGKEHEQGHERAVQTRSTALFVGSTFTGIASLLAIWKPVFAVIAGLGVIATAYAAFSDALSAVDLDETNADRYEKGEELLWERKLELDEYRQKVARGEEGAVEEFFEPVFVVLETDHKAFLSDAEKRELAIGQMEKRLDAAIQARNGENNGNG